jgi:hypothetical protein
MLQSLDSIIAFVTIMTITSLFVTVVVQMISAALSLRGKNLANALALTFQTLDPSVANGAYELTARILSDPLLSDSTRTVKRKSASAEIPARDKPWHFANPKGAMRLANAIRPQEVYEALVKLSTSYMTTAQPTAGTETGARTDESVKRVHSAGQLANQLLEALRTPTTNMTAGFEAIAKAVEATPDPQAKQKAQDLIRDTSAGLLLDEDAARAKFVRWFSAAEDRSQQWFQLHTRGITIATSLLLALVFQLDAVEIFRYTSSNAAARAALLADANRIVKEGDGALDEKGGLIQRIADAWNERTNSGGLRIERLGNIVHTGQLEDAIEKLYAEKPDPAFKTKKDLERAFEKLAAVTTKAYYRDQSQKISDLTKAVSATGFDLFPPGFWRWPASENPGDSRQALANIVPHLFGVSLFAALLTLGAPYWYNVLKNFTSLRPALAQLIGNEESDSTRRRE